MNLDRFMASRNDPTDSTRVYLTTARDFAVGWAIRYANAPFKGARHGALYRVEPHGDVEPDPDFPESAGAWMARGATVVAVDKAKVSGSVAAHIKRTGKYATWSDNSPVYTQDGYLRPDPKWAQAGITETDLRGYGKWVPHDVVGYVAATGRMQSRAAVLLEEERRQREFFANHVRDNVVVGAVYVPPAPDAVDAYDQRYRAYAQGLLDQGVEFGVANSPAERESATRLIRAEVPGEGNFALPDGATVLVATGADRVIAGAMVILAVKTATSSFAFLTHVVVDKRWRYRGLGSVLVGMLPMLRTGTMTVGTCNDADRAFYEKAAFTVLGPGEALPPSLLQGAVLPRMAVMNRYNCWFYRPF